MTSYQTLRLERAGGVATVTLDRPGRMNGMTSLMVREAHDALADVAGDPSISVLVLTGAGSAEAFRAFLERRHPVFEGR